MLMLLEDAVFTIKQVPPVTVISQVTASPLTSAADVYVLDAPLCTLTPLILKLYVTVPLPVLVALAVNVTDVPAQIKPCGETAILTAGVEAITIINIVLEDAVFAVKQVPPVIVISQVTASALTSEDEE